MKCHFSDTYLDSDMINLVSEMEIMKSIGTHNNVLQLLGCCTRDGCLLVITEFARFGNLRDFLRRHVPSENDVKPSSNLSVRNLLNFAVQITKGMEYLALKKVLSGFEIIYEHLESNYVMYLLI